MTQEAPVAAEPFEEFFAREYPGAVRYARRVGPAGTVKSTTSRALSSLRQVVDCCPKAA